MASSGITASLECAICYNEAEEEEAKSWVALIPCGHFFHPTCIDKWIASKLRPGNRGIAAHLSLVDWSCPICRHPMPYRVERLTPLERNNLCKGYTSVKLDIDSSTANGSGETTIVLEKTIEKLEKELNEEKENKEHWMKVYEVVEATHSELLEFKTEDYRKQLETLQAEVEMLKERIRQKEGGSEQGRARGPAKSSGKAMVTDSKETKEEVPRDSKKRKPSGQTEAQTQALLVNTTSTIPKETLLPVSKPRLRRSEAAAVSLAPTPASHPPQQAITFDFNSMQGLPSSPAFKAKRKGKEATICLTSKRLSPLQSRRASAKRTHVLPLSSLQKMELPIEAKEAISVILGSWKKASMRMDEDSEEEL